METPTRTTEPGGPNRRDVLRRGAILGGALVWTTPIVQSLAGPAFAAGTTCASPVVVRAGSSPSSPCLFTITYTANNDCCDCIATQMAGGANEAAALFLCQGMGQCTVGPVGPC